MHACRSTLEDPTAGTVLLSNAANTLTATTLNVGDSGANNGAGVVSVLQLGTGTNVIQADSLFIGRGKASGEGAVKFASQTAGSPGTVTITNKAGTGAAAIQVGNSNGTDTGAAAIGTLDLRGHAATVTAGTLLIGNNNVATLGGNVTGTVSFDAGTFTVATLTMGTKTAAGTGAANATLNVGGGAFNVTAGFTLGSQASAGTANATVNITGGTLTSSVAILDGGGAAASTVVLNGGTLDLGGGGTPHALGGATPIDTLTLQAGTLRNVSQINNGASALTKTGAGTLTLSGTNTYTGGTTVSAGTLLVMSINATGTGAVTVDATGTLGGSGSIAGAVTVNTGGTLSPGTSPGTLSVAGPVTLGTGGTSAAPTYLVELLAAAAPVAGTDNDLLALTGSGANGVLTLSNPDALNLVALSGIATQTTYTIATFASEAGVFDTVLVNGQPSQNSNPSGANYALVTYNPTNILVTVNNLTAVPEPATAGLLGLVATGLLARRGRRHRA